MKNRTSYKTVEVEKAIGMVLAHDVTEIRPGEYKGPAFKKGHRIEAGDVCHLQRLGKRHIYVIADMPGYLHENEAAVALANAFCGVGVEWRGEPSEGKLKLQAATDGLFKVNTEVLLKLNLLGDIMCASRHTNTLVDKGAVVAATRAIPLMIQSDIVEKAVRSAESAEGLFRVLPLKKARAGVIITGNEVFARLIKDRFEPILHKKIEQLGSRVQKVAFTPDDPAIIADNLHRMIAAGADLVLTTGGMSVDPDDTTRTGIAQAGGKILFYGAPVLPGAMFMLAMLNGVPILGIPACGIFHEITLLDLMLPRILAGDEIKREDIAALGHGGLCLHCSECRFPVCPFGKQA